MKYILYKIKTDKMGILLTMVGIYLLYFILFQGKFLEGFAFVTIWLLIWNGKI